VEPGYLNDPRKFSTLNAALAVPVEGVQSVVAVLALYRAQRDSFTSDHLRILQALSSKLGLAIENALRYRQAEVSAVTDYLTGLPNARSLFLKLNEEVSRCRAAEMPLTVVVCDLDNFKSINDEYGHLEGNRVLKTLAQALRRNCRETDHVARMGGDEFVVIFPGLGGPEAGIRIDRLRRTVVQQAQAETRLPLSMSTGAAQFPLDGESTEELLAAADRIMYTAKRSLHANAPQRETGPAMRLPASIQIQ
jgi:diguanylate cyclase (GGDEF)-like protein